MERHLGDDGEMNMAKAILLLITPWLAMGQSRAQSDDDHLRAMALVQGLSDHLVPALRNVSAAGWKWESLADALALDATARTEQKKSYQRMLKQARRLGAFRNCAGLNIDVPANPPVQQALQLGGPCSFAEGEAEVTMVFDLSGQSPRPVSLQVSPQPTRTR
jgi:hypothetical protein